MSSIARIVIDPTRCRGHGTCVALLPAHLTLDRWHFPLVTEPLVDPRDEAVRLARHLCPELAFHVIRDGARETQIG